MIEPESHEKLRVEIAERIRADRKLLDDLRDEVRPLRTQVHRIQPSTPDARLVVRFGGISDRSADPLDILKDSFRGSRWRLETVVGAGSADLGRRQAGHFSGHRPQARQEYDAWLRLTG